MTTVLVTQTMVAVKVMTHPHGQTVVPVPQAVTPTTHVLVVVLTVHTMAIHPILAVALAAPTALLPPKVRGILRALAVEQPALMVKVARTVISAVALTATITLPTLAVGTTIAATAVEEAVIVAQVRAVQVQAAAVQAQVAAVPHADHAKWLVIIRGKENKILFRKRQTV